MNRLVFGYYWLILNYHPAFARFTNQHDAHVFARVVTKDKSRKLMYTGIEVVPEDIIWNNTRMNPYQRKIGTIVSWAITIALIIIWAPLLTFVGMVSNVDTLCTKASWLAWLCSLPLAVLGEFLSSMTLYERRLLQVWLIRSWCTQE